MKRILNLSRPVAGVLLCAGAALLTAMVAASRPWRAFVPFAFVAVIVVLAARYGHVVSIFGSLAAAAVFAYFFAPSGRLSVASPMERSSLGWMLLGSVVISYLLWPPQPHSK